MLQNSIRSLKRSSHFFSSAKMFSTLKDEVKTINAEEFFKIVKDPVARKEYQIIDVRESNELEISSIPDREVLHLPLSQSGTWASEVALGTHKNINSDLKSICVCHHGMRSLKVANFLVHEAGFPEVYNLAGGIHALSQLDSSIPQY